MTAKFGEVMWLPNLLQNNLASLSQYLTRKGQGMGDYPQTQVLKAEGTFQLNAF